MEGGRDELTFWHTKFEVTCETWQVELGCRQLNESETQKSGLALAIISMEVLFAIMRMNGITQRENILRALKKANLWPLV